MRAIGGASRGINVVSQTQLDDVADTILIAGLTDNLSSLASASLTATVRSASHRSTNGYSVDQANTQAYFGSQEDGATRPPVWALNYRQITTGGNQIFNLCKTTPRTDDPKSVHAGGGRIEGGDSCGLADGSAKYRKFSLTLNVNPYMRGVRLSAGARWGRSWPGSKAPSRFPAQRCDPPPLGSCRLAQCGRPRRSAPVAPASWPR